MWSSVQAVVCGHQVTGKEASSWLSTFGLCPEKLHTCHFTQSSQVPSGMGSSSAIVQCLKVVLQNICAQWRWHWLQTQCWGCGAPLAHPQAGDKGNGFATILTMLVLDLWCSWQCGGSLWALQIWGRRSEVKPRVLHNSDVRFIVSDEDKEVIQPGHR